jgi:hypothetical protein
MGGGGVGGGISSCAIFTTHSTLTRPEIWIKADFSQWDTADVSKVTKKNNSQTNLLTD